MATCKECGQEIPHYSGKPLTNTMYRYVDAKTGKFVGIINGTSERIDNEQTGVNLIREDLFKAGMTGLSKLVIGIDVVTNPSIQLLTPSSVAQNTAGQTVQKVTTGLDLTPGAGIVQQEVNPNLGKKVV